MKIPVKVVFVCLVSLSWIELAVCDGTSNISDVTKWTCHCTSAYQRNESYLLVTNCSTSCDCSPAGGSNQNNWTCICAADKFPEIAATVNDTKCFSSCNCMSGSFTENQKQSSRKRISRKAVIIVLLLCAVLVTLAFLASVAFYIYRQEKCSIQSPLFSSDKLTSCNSATNLISHGSHSGSDSRIILSSSGKTVAGCFGKASFLFRTTTGTLLGTLIQFTYSELEVATDKFSQDNLVGCGGSSYVYRGQLKDGKIIAVKRLKDQGGSDANYIFFSEIELLSRLYHCHVVPLLGYCCETQGKHTDRVLVFEYMPLGNLRDCLDGVARENMNWATRVSIALGAAKGLEYLHEAAAPRILHRDVKSTNILLDENWKAKITDLGMAKRLRADGIPSCSSSPARMQGTFGYFAPEYAIVGRASFMSDVFSFGVVLLELLTGRQPIHKSANRGEESLVMWATPRLQDNKRVIQELPDSDLKGEFPEDEMQIMAYLAKECLLLDPDSRPTMSEVVQILSTIAPDTRKRNFPVTVFQRPLNHYAGYKADMRKPDNQGEGLSEAEAVKRAAQNTWSTHSSLPLNIDRTLCMQSGNDSVIVSPEYIKRLMLLSSDARTLHTSDDETVDLTEPRFESF